MIKVAVCLAELPSLRGRCQPLLDLLSLQRRLPLRGFAEVPDPPRGEGYQGKILVNTDTRLLLFPSS